MSEQPGRTRWTLACRDDAGRDRVHHVEVTEHGVVRLVPPMVGATSWEPDQIDRARPCVVGCACGSDEAS